MKNIWALGAVSIAIAGCGELTIDLQGTQVKGSGNLKTENRTVGNFRQVESRGAVDCEITVGKAASLTISADDNILPLIETNVENGILIISTKGSYSTKNGAKALITVPELHAFAVKGAGDSKIDGLRGRSFDVSISGSGDITGRGQVENVRASISGSGDINLADVLAKKAEVSIAGSGDISLHASESLTASIRGSGDISYSGNPKNVQKSVSGSGDIHPR